ncbi:MAG: addiction module toxin RelE [Novosphingobium sp.]
MEIQFSKTAAKSLLRSDKRVLIRQKIDELAQGPLSLSANIVRLQGRSDYRLRVQNWRIIFRMDEATLWIDDIAPRGAVYEE